MATEKVQCSEVQLKVEVEEDGEEEKEGRPHHRKE